MMLELLLSKKGLYVAATIIVIASGSYLLHNWHFAPISLLEKKVVSLERQLKVTGSALNICEANLTKQKLQGFIDGIGANDEDIVIDFSNAFY